MAACSPQRFLPNNRNAFANAILSASSVLPVENKVQSLPTARSGTAQVALTGMYTGSEQAEYELEIVDTDVEVGRVSAPTFSGVGSGTISDIAASGTQQIYTVQLSNAGTKTTTASVQLEGATIEALAEGAGGNDIRITVDQSTLVFTASDYSLLVDLQAGQGGSSSPLIGQGFDWDSSTLDGNGLIPAGAHRIAFGSDRSAVYLAYRNYVDGRWQYHTVPALQRDVPKGTQIYFVTGGRTVTVSNGALATEIYEDIETAYDLLYRLRTESGLVVVDGVVANDRSPTGQASRELTLRTDAHAEVSSGSGSSYAKGLEDVTVDSAAGTQLVTLTCYAINSGDHPFAHLGEERWQVESSLFGTLGTVITGVPFNFPGLFGGTIPVRLPIDFDMPKGRFSVDEIIYATATETPICPVSLTLGPDAVDQVIDLIWTARPSGDCDCTGMTAPNLKTACLGNPTEGGGLMAYETDARERMIELRRWLKETIRFLSLAIDPPASAVQANFIKNPIDSAKIDGTIETNPALSPWYARNTESLMTVVDNFENALALIDALRPVETGSLRWDGMEAWDVAVAEMRNDIDQWTGIDASPPVPKYLQNIPSDRYNASINVALITAGIPTVGGADADTIVSGDGCWRDWGGSAYFRVVGSLKGPYKPLWPNRPYYSARDSAEGGVFSTHEFALQVNVKCPEDLQIGDRVRLVISESNRGATYVQGDQIEQAIVAAAPLYLSGGRNGNPIQTWNVNGSVDGPLAAYTFNPESPTAYSVPGLGFMLTEGGIAWEQGDRYRFAVEGGHFRWRKDGGAWNDDSPPLPIPLASVLIDEGLSASFTAGAAASFVTGDRFRFRALQPWAVSNTQSPSSAVWRWDGATATYDADLGSIQQLDLIAIVHNLPAGATVALATDTGVLLGEDGMPLLNEDGTELLTEGFVGSEALTYRAGIIWQEIDKYARYVRLTISNATGGSIQWPWIGQPITTTLSGEVQLRQSYLIDRPGGSLQGGRYKGKAVSGDVSWTEAALVEADVTALAAMLDHVKENNDEPIMFIKQVTRVDEPVLLAHINKDEIDFPDPMAYNQNIEFERRVSASIPLAGVWQ